MLIVSICIAIIGFIIYVGSLVVSIKTESPEVHSQGVILFCIAIVTAFFLLVMMFISNPEYIGILKDDSGVFVAPVIPFVS